METNKTLEYTTHCRTYGDTFVINHGRLDNNQIKTIVVNDLSVAKRLALDFTQVIPCDPAGYQKRITEWTGNDSFLMTHQDDDSFFFSAIWTPGLFWNSEDDVLVKSQLEQFKKFINTFRY